MPKLRVGVIFGGRSGEHDVSLMSARSVMSALDPSKYDIVPIAITHEGRWLTGSSALDGLQSGRIDGLIPVVILPEPGSRSLYRWDEGQALDVLVTIDVVFPLVHGSFGEDGTLQGLLELAELPYVGSGVLASAVAMDKGLFKSLMRAHGVPVLDFTVLSSAQMENDPDLTLDQAEAVAPYPLFTKPANLGSSVGVSKCRSRSDLVEGMLDALRYDRRVLVERGLEAREVEVSVLGNEEPQASVAGEVVPSDEFYSYRAKYLDDASELRIPAPIDQATTEEARRLALIAFHAIDGAGMARVDFLLDKTTGELFLSEVNTIPGFTRISMYPKLWQASGVTYPNLLDRLIDLGVRRHAQMERLVREYGGEA